jgi:hypothetical protein
MHALIGALLASCVAQPSVPSGIAAAYPRHGAVELQYMLVDAKSASFVAIGHDFSTGSWYKCTELWAMGANPNDKTLFKAVNSPWQEMPFCIGHSEALDTEYPYCMLGDLMSRRQYVDEAQELAAGASKIVAKYPGGSRASTCPDMIQERRDAPPLSAWIILSPEGRIERLGRSTVTGQDMVVSYTGALGVPGFSWIPTTITTPTFAMQVVGFKVYPNGKADLVTKERLEKIALLQRTYIEVRLAEIGEQLPMMVARYIPDGMTPAMEQVGFSSPAEQSADRLPLAPGPWDRRKWPLIATGVALVVLGVIAWYRKR